MNRKNGLVQSDIFSAMENLKSLSNKQNRSKNLSKKITSPLLIEIDDKEDAETYLKDSYSVSRKRSKQVNISRKLPFTFEDDGTDNEVSAKCTRTPKYVEMMAVNKPNASSTPLKSSKSKPNDEIVMNSTNPTSNISSPSNSTLNASALSSLDTTIIQKSHENGKVFIQQNIVISPVKEATVTSNSDRNCSIINRSTITSNTSTSSDNGIRPSNKEKEYEAVAVSPDKTVAFYYISKPFFRTAKQNKVCVQLDIDKSSTFTTPIKGKLDNDTNSASPQKITSPKKGPKMEMNKIIYQRYVSLIIDLFDNVCKSTYLKNIIEEDTKILDVFFNAPEKYQFFCIKLYTWLPKWYNIFKFCHKINLEMTDHEINQLYKFLQKNKIIDTDYSNENVADLLNRLDKSDIQDICKTLFKWNIQKSNKEDLVNKLIKYSQTQSTLSFGKSLKDLILEQIKKKIGFGMKLNESFRNVFQRVYLLGTFTNKSFTSINDFFKEMLVPTRISPDFAVEEYLVFHTREDFLSYAAAVKYSDILENALASRESLIIFENCKVIYEKLRAIGEGNQTDDVYREAPHLKRFTAKYVYVRALSRAVECLKTKYPDDVKDWLEYMIFKTELLHRNGTWYYQLIWLHMKHLNPVDYERAAKLLLEVLKSKKERLSEVQLYELGEMGEKLKISKKHKIEQFEHDCITELVPEPIELEDFPVITVPATAKRSNETGKKRKYVVRDDEGNTTYQSVEDIALDYYLDGYSYTDGRHCEGSLIKATFTLFFWDIIYNPEIIVPAVFLSKLQSEPLDMRTRYFYENRKKAIDRRLQEIHSIWSVEQIKDFVKNNWTQHSHETGFCEAGLYIENIELLEILVDCIGRKVLSKIYERLVKNIRQYSSGIPDLLVWNVPNKKSKFVEVKGENDRLSIGQKLWLKYLKSIGADVEVCLVHSTGSKRKSLKKLEGQKPEPSNKRKDFKASPSSTKKEKLKSDVKRGSKKLNSAAGEGKSKTSTYLSRKMSDFCTSSEESDFPSSD